MNSTDAGGTAGSSPLILRAVHDDGYRARFGDLLWQVHQWSTASAEHKLVAKLCKVIARAMLLGSLAYTALYPIYINVRYDVRYPGSAYKAAFSKDHAILFLEWCAAMCVEPLYKYVKEKLTDDWLAFWAKTQERNKTVDEENVSLNPCQDLLEGEYSVVDPDAEQQPIGGLLSKRISSLEEKLQALEVTVRASDQPPAGHLTDAARRSTVGNFK